MTGTLNRIEEEFDRFGTLETRVVLALVDVAKAAQEPVDIGDEVNRCRICWKKWGKHADDCALARLEDSQ